MRKIYFTIVIAILTFLGGFLLFVPFEDDRGLWRREQHLKIIQEQLAAIKQHLLEYKAVHDQYPSNNEGLTVLDNFESRFKITYYRDTDEHRNFSTGFYGSRYGFWWQIRKRAIQEFRDEFGRVPQNEKDFSESGLGMDLDMGPYHDDDDLAFEVEIAIGKNNDIYILHSDSILSPWLIPYNYENRNGLEASLFQDSPANYDSEEQYSICIDEGIFVYSTGGQLHLKEINNLTRNNEIPKYFGAGLILLALILMLLQVYLHNKIRSFFYFLASGAVSLGLGLGYISSTSVTCYVMSPLFYFRNPEIVQRQKELLEKQYQRGIIKQETYRKALLALEVDLTKESEEDTQKD